MRIVGVTPEPGANTEYRVRLPVEALAARGHVTEVAQWDFYLGADPPSMATLRAADVVHIWRLHEPPVRRLAAALREAGVAVVWDNDDDLMRRPEINSVPKHLSAAKEKTNSELVAMMRLSDVVTVTCDELARRFRKQSGADVRIVENYVEGGFVQPVTIGQGEVVIGWVAGGEHRIDVKQLRLRQTLERVLQRHPQVHVLSVGLDLGLRSDRYHRNPGVAFTELPSVIASFDIGIAPIANVSFNRTRSNVKLKEYAASGVPWLASATGPYRGLGEQQGGRLVQDPLWQKGLEDLISDDAARAELSERAAAWGRSQTIEANAHHWEKVFTDAMERARARAGLSPASEEPVVPDDGRAAGEPASPPEHPPSDRKGLLRRLTGRRAARGE